MAEQVCKHCKKAIEKIDGIWADEKSAYCIVGGCLHEPSPEPDVDATVDEIISALYRRFKEWSRRNFGPDDVTWCEVKADVTALIDLKQQAQLVAMKQSLGECVEALERIVAVASGELQVANDDTEGMAWIDSYARAALTNAKALLEGKPYDALSGPREGEQDGKAD